ncbi:MAG: hypothetical protein Q9162_007939, partial [Coniocarpon cinnabarinum]
LEEVHKDMFHPLSVFYAKDLLLCMFLAHLAYRITVIFLYMRTLINAVHEDKSKCFCGLDA